MAKSKLAAALVAQSSRLKHNARERERSQQSAKQAAEAGAVKARRATRTNARSQKTRAQAGTIPFTPGERVLLVGEGDLSFARALSQHPKLTGLHIVASTLDTEEALAEKYPDTAPSNVRELRSRGVTVLCGIDATRLRACKALRGRVFDKIVWNFPHVGKGIADQDRNVLENQKTLLAFFAALPPFLEQGPFPARTNSKTAKRRSGDDEDDEADEDDEDDENVLSTGTRGTVLVTLRDAPPYTLWDLPRLAKRPPTADSPKFSLVRSFAFARAEWAALGYKHRMTKGHVEGIVTGGQKAGGNGERTWEFALNDSD